MPVFVKCFRCVDVYCVWQACMLYKHLKHHICCINTGSTTYVAMLAVTAHMQATCACLLYAIVM